MANFFSASTSAFVAAVTFSTVTLGIAISPALIADLNPAATIRIANDQPAIAGSTLSSSARPQV